MLLAGTVCLVSTAWATKSTLSLNVGQATYKINRELYGALMENTNRTIYTGVYVGIASSIPNINGMRKDVIAGFKEGGVSNLCFPGGCFAEKYKWRDGIGPKASRPSGDMTNGLGTDEYFQLCDSVGSIPYITADITNDSVASMSAWLNYIDSLYPNKIKYWKMGNEPWGGCNAIGIATLTITKYLETYEKYLAGIPAKFSGRIFRIADGGSGNGSYSYWVDSLMRREKGRIDGVTLHYYPSFSGPSIGFTSAQYYSELQGAYKMNGYVGVWDNIMKKYDSTYNVGLMVDEWGAWYTTLTQGYTQSTCRDAVIASMNLNIFNNNCRRVKMACVAQPVNFIQPLFLTKNPSTTDMVKTPTFYVFKMYKVHQKALMVPSTLTTSTNQTIPIIIESASVDSMGKLHVSMCNTHISDADTVTITLNNASTYSSCSGTIITGPTDSSYNDFSAAEKVNIQNFPGATMSGKTVTVPVPGHSVVTLELIPATGTTWNPKMANSAKAWSVEALAGGAIKVWSSVAEESRVSLSLFGIDGRTIAFDQITIKPGERSIVWQPGKRALCAGVYIMSINDGKQTVAQRIAISR